MTSAIRLDHLNKEILISKSFAKSAMNPTSNAYKDLAEVMATHPNYKVNERVIKQNPRKEKYKGLTYERMREYIILHSTPEEESMAVAEFDEMILISKCHAQAYRYPTIKKWFLNKYPEISKFGTIEAEYETQFVG